MNYGIYFPEIIRKEMADMLIESSMEITPKRISSDTYQVSPEYWAGWVMAYYHFCDSYRT